MAETAGADPHQELVVRLGTAAVGDPVEGLTVTVHEPRGDVACPVELMHPLGVPDGPLIAMEARCLLTPGWVVDLEIAAETVDGRPVLYERIVRLDDLGSATLNYVIDDVGGVPVVQRTVWSTFDAPTELLGRDIALQVGLGWGLLCAVYVAVLVLGARRRP